MRFARLKIPELVRIDQDPIVDSRGFFARLLCRDELQRHGIDGNIVQCNNTLTHKRGSVRGFHFQRPPRAETKIVRCVSGAILDAAVDLRLGSATYGQYCSCELNASNRSMLMIPPGFAHGFQTMSDDVELIYFHSEPYSPEHEGGVNPMDTEIAIEWPLPIAEMSERDRKLPPLSSVEPLEL